MRADHKEGVSHANRFGASSTQAFLKAVSLRLAERGLTRVFTLFIAGKPVASRVAFVVGDSLYLYFSGFDPTYGKYSIMTTTVAEAIKYAIAHGFKTVNLSSGTDTSKSRWGARILEFSEEIQVRERTRSKLAYSLYRIAREPDTAPPWLSPVIKKLPKRAWK